MAISRSLILVSCIFLLFACAKTQVRIYPEKPTKAEPLAKASPMPTPKPSPKEPSSGKTPSAETYDGTVSKWRSYQDLVRWMEKDFSIDAARFEKFEGTLPPPQTVEETFELRSGIHIDAAFFIKRTLNRINPSYEAKVVVIIIRPYGSNHYACSFKLDGKLYIMDYGTSYKTITGLHGPYDSLEEYKEFYAKNLPTKPRIEAITYLP